MALLFSVLLMFIAKHSKYHHFLLCVISMNWACASKAEGRWEGEWVGAISITEERIKKTTSTNSLALDLIGEAKLLKKILAEKY